MTDKVKRAALYVRVSTDHQTLENQTRELARSRNGAAGKS
jgi:DNA invertase Pin-like site-specific DNA recombinase